MKSWINIMDILEHLSYADISERLLKHLKAISARTSRIKSGSMINERDTLGKTRCFNPSQVKNPLSHPQILTVSPRP